MNERLADALDSWWWGGDSSNVSPGAQGSSAQQASSGPQKPSFSWWPWWGGSSSGNRASRPAPQQQRSQSGKARLARQRSTPANLDAAGKAKQARVPRAASTSKLQPGATAVQATAAAGSGAEAQQQAAAGGGEAVAAKKPLSSRQLKAAEGQSKAGSKLSINKQMSYQERRRLWQERLEHAKAKAERRAAAAAEGVQPPPVARKYSGAEGRSKISVRHIAIPVPPSKLGISSHSTPAGSPSKRGAGLLHSEAEGAGQQQAPGSGRQPGASSPTPFLEVPPIWQGYETADAPTDFSSAGADSLRRFLAQAGRSPDAVGLLSQDELAGAARDCRGTWEVERIMVACQWPQEVLRVARDADPAVLKAAYRRVSMLVHPDKNIAAGASDAMAVVADAYQLLSMSKAAAIPAYMRQNHPTRQSHLNPQQQGSNGAAPGAGSAAEAGPTPYTAASFAAAASGGGGAGSSGGMSHTASFGDFGEQRGQEQQQTPRRSSSSSGVEGEGQPERPSSRTHHLGTDGHDHWNPHGHLSSNEELSPQQQQQPPSAAGQDKGAAGLDPGAAWPEQQEQQAAPLQSPGRQTGASPASSSKASTPERPASATPGHSRSSSAHSSAGLDAAGLGAAAAGVQQQQQGGSSAGSSTVGRAAAPAAQKIRVTVKYRTAIPSKK